jgi:hypothetical protein
MTTFNGVMRSVAAAARRAERENQKRARESARQFKTQQKLQALENALDDYENYTDYIDTLQSIHKGDIEPIDWELILDEPKPEEPVPQEKYGELAKAAKATYVPSFFDKLLGRVSKKNENLDRAITVGISRDRSIYEAEVKKHEEALIDWNKLQLIAKKVLTNECEAYRDALEYFNPYSEISALGSNLSMRINPDHIEIDLHVNSTEVIPNYVLTLTSTGKLSRKSMPVSRFNELYQDHICSCVLRIARETIAHLPIKFVVINAISKLLNSKTGRVEEQAVVSVAVYPETFQYINFESIDPSDCMSNFIHNMKFSKTTGLTPVDKLDSTTLIR